MSDTQNFQGETHTFQAEIKQLLNILVHSLYTDSEIFLRELISNASDALSKLQFEMLTNDDVLDPEVELAINVEVDPDAKTIRISDTGIGMTKDEMMSNLGVIAQSGARSFLEKLQDNGDNVATDLIGQFGVGFYSVFMAADKVEVTSRSYLPDEQAYTWISSGEDSYEIIESDKATRGTEILIHLRDDAEEFATQWKIRQAIKHHSDFVAFPIYLEDLSAEKPDDEDESMEDRIPEAVNQQQAIWRRSTGDIEDEEYNNFYRMLTLDMEDPLMRIHAQGDAPIQYYALLYIPKKAERNMFSTRKEPGLKLYARKVLIQEYTTDLLPEYLQFVQGVVDSEDITLNVSRETVRANQQMAQLKQTVTRRVLRDIKRMADDDENPELYAEFWAEYSPFLKHGVISEYGDRDRLLPLLRFNTDQHPDALVTLDEYVERLEAVEGQNTIYYIMADSVAAASRSPHLDPFRARGIEVLYLTERADGFLVTALTDYKGYKLVSVDSADLELDGVGELNEEDAQEDPADDNAVDQLVVRMRNVLGEAVESVRVSKVLFSGSPVRLVAPEGAIDRHTQQVYKMLERDFEVPTRIMEINPRHQIIKNLAGHLEGGVQGDEMVDNTISILYENALLAEGLHPNPAELAQHIQKLMEVATSPS